MCSASSLSRWSPSKPGLTSCRRTGAISSRRSNGEGKELGRITVWEPSGHLAWKSSVDDVEIDVQFVAVDSGTEVTVRAAIPAKHPTKPGRVTVAGKPSADLPPGTERSILRQAGLRRSS